MKTAAVAAMSALALTAATATAQAPGAPAPGCFGINVSDRKGDADPANADVTAAWFDVKDGTHFAHIRVADLDDAVPEAATGVRWYFLWTWEGAEHFVAASKVTAAGANGPTAFTYGTRDADGFNTEGNPDGTFFPGPDGVIQIEIPAEAGGAEGQTLAKPHLATFTSVGVPGVAQTGSELDNTGNGRDHAVGPCAAPAPAPPASPAAPPAARDGVLHVTVSRRLPAARKVKRSLPVRLSSAEAVTNVTAVLRRGTKKVGSGRLARVQGKATLKLKVARLKKGAHTLDLHGINADGGAGRLSVRLRLR